MKLFTSGVHALLFFLPVTISTVQAQRFGPVITYSTGNSSYPKGVALGDLNGDSRLDIVTANNNTGAGVLLSLPGGGFSPVATYALGNGVAPMDLALGDVDNDGLLDIVLANALANSTGVRLGRAGGRFGPVTNYASGGSGSNTVVLGDVNGDSQLDIVMVNSTSATVSVLLGQAGGFAPATIYGGSPYPAGMGTPYGVALGDMNADGRLDIVTTDIGAIGIRLGQPGGFGPFRSYTAGNNHLYALKLGDMNNDGWLDVVGVSSSPHTVEVLLGQNGGTLGPVTTYLLTAGSNIFSMELGDVTGDGLLDVITANTNSQMVEVLPSLPGGSMGTLVTYAAGATTTGGGDTQSVTLGDINDDGWPDIVVANAYSSNVGVLLATVPIPQTTLVFTPSVGLPGTTISVDGTNLSGATALLFPGSSANIVTTGFTVNAAGTRITGIRVPQGARSGHVRVLTPQGIQTSNTRFTVQTLTSTRTGTSRSVLALFPTPTRTQTSLRLPDLSEATTATLLNALGRTALTYTIPAHATATLDLSGLAPGLYVVRCGAASAKLVVE